MTARAWFLRALLVVGLLVARPALAEEDPGATGPYAVTVTSYGSNLPQDSITLGSIANIEVLAQVHYPTNLSNGPYPLVVLLHGRHWPCYAGTDTFSPDWPCQNGFTPVPSYQGYDYLAALLASHGMIVASISANGINAADNDLSDSWGAEERALLIQHHLGKWSTFNGTGGAPFGTTFVGKVDLSRVGTMGHSRGGEAVIWHYELNASQGNPYGIKAIFPMAPTNKWGHHVNDVPVGVLLPYCDGDVHELAGVAYFDDARYASETDAAPKYTFLGLGANHNYFNRYWTPDQFMPADDDWINRDTTFMDPWCGTNAPGNGRLTSAQQRAFGAAYVAAFLRRHLLGAKQFDNILRGSSPPPPSAQTSLVYNAYLPGAFDRKDLNRLWISSDVTDHNTLGGTVGSSGLGTYAQCGDWTGLMCVSTGTDAHYPSLSALELGWSSLGASYSNGLPAFKRDVSNFSTVQLRAGLDFSDSRNTSPQAQDFSVELTDGAGRTFAVKASSYSGLLYYPPAITDINQLLQRLRPASVMNTLRIPLSAFVGVDKTSLTTVKLLFNQKAKGDVLVSDIAFAEEGTTVAERWLVSSGVVVAD